MLHKNSVLNHKIENYTYANAAARTGATGFVSGDLGKVAYQTDEGSYWRLTATTPTWVLLSVAQKIEAFTYASTAARTGASGFVAGDVGKIAFQSNTATYWRLTATTPTWQQLVLQDKIEAYTYANAAARTGATGFITEDLGKIAYQSDTGAYYRLTATAPTWVQVGGGGGSGIDDQGALGQMIFGAGVGTPGTWGFGPTGVKDMQYSEGGGQTTTTEAYHFTTDIPASSTGNGINIAGVRFRFWGRITNGTTAITFTARIRWHTSTSTPASGTALLTIPIVGTTTALSNKKWLIEGTVSFVGSPTTGFYMAQANVIEHTSLTTGAPTVDCVDSGDAASLPAVTSLHKLGITWELSGTTGSPAVFVTGGLIEYLRSIYD